MDRHGAAGEGSQRPDRVHPGPGVVFAYLFLVGLYESTAIPIAALLSVIVGLFGAVSAL